MKLKFLLSSFYFVLITSFAIAQTPYDLGGSVTGNGSEIILYTSSFIPGATTGTYNNVREFNACSDNIEVVHIIDNRKNDDITTKTLKVVLPAGISFEFIKSNAELLTFKDDGSGSIDKTTTFQQNNVTINGQILTFTFSEAIKTKSKIAIQYGVKINCDWANNSIFFDKELTFNSNEIAQSDKNNNSFIVNPYSWEMTHDAAQKEEIRYKNFTKTLTLKPKGNNIIQKFKLEYSILTPGLNLSSISVVGHPEATITPVQNKTNSYEVELSAALTVTDKLEIAENFKVMDCATNYEYKTEFTPYCSVQSQPGYHTNSINENILLPHITISNDQGSLSVSVGNLNSAEQDLFYKYVTIYNNTGIPVNDLKLEFFSIYNNTGYKVYLVEKNGAESELFYPYTLKLDRINDNTEYNDLDVGNSFKLKIVYNQPTNCNDYLLSNLYFSSNCTSSIFQYNIYDKRPIARFEKYECSGNQYVQGPIDVYSGVASDKYYFKVSASKGAELEINVPENVIIDDFSQTNLILSDGYPKTNISDKSKSYKFTFATDQMAVENYIKIKFNEPQNFIDVTKFISFSVKESCQINTQREFYQITLHNTNPIFTNLSFNIERNTFGYEMVKLPPSKIFFELSDFSGSAYTKVKAKDDNTLDKFINGDKAIVTSSFNIGPDVNIGDNIKIKLENFSYLSIDNQSFKVKKNNNDLNRLIDFDYNSSDKTITLSKNLFALNDLVKLEFNANVIVPADNHYNSQPTLVVSDGTDFNSIQKSIIVISDHYYNTDIFLSNVFCDKNQNYDLNRSTEYFFYMYTQNCLYNIFKNEFRPLVQFKIPSENQSKTISETNNDIFSSSLITKDKIYYAGNTNPVDKVNFNINLKDLTKCDLPFIKDQENIVENQILTQKKYRIYTSIYDKNKNEYVDNSMYFNTFKNFQLNYNVSNKNSILASSKQISWTFTLNNLSYNYYSDPFLYFTINTNNTPNITITDYKVDNGTITNFNKDNVFEGRYSLGNLANVSHTITIYATINSCINPSLPEQLELNFGWSCTEDLNKDCLNSLDDKNTLTLLYAPTFTNLVKNQLFTPDWNNSNPNCGFSLQSTLTNNNSADIYDTEYIVEIPSGLNLSNLTYFTYTNLDKTSINYNLTSDDLTSYIVDNKGVKYYKFKLNEIFKATSGVLQGSQQTDIGLLPKVDFNWYFIPSCDGNGKTDAVWKPELPLNFSVAYKDLCGKENTTPKLSQQLLPKGFSISNDKVNLSTNLSTFGGCEEATNFYFSADFSANSNFDKPYCIEVTLPKGVNFSSQTVSQDDPTQKINTSSGETILTWNFQASSSKLDGGAVIAGNISVYLDKDFVIPNTSQKGIKIDISKEQVNFCNDCKAYSLLTSKSDIIDFTKGGCGSCQLLGECEICSSDTRTKFIYNSTAPLGSTFVWSCSQGFGTFANTTNKPSTLNKSLETSTTEFSFTGDLESLAGKSGTISVTVTTPEGATIKHDLEIKIKAPKQLDPGFSLDLAPCAGYYMTKTPIIVNVDNYLVGSSYKLDINNDGVIDKTFSTPSSEIRFDTYGRYKIKMYQKLGTCEKDSDPIEINVVDLLSTVDKQICVSPCPLNTESATITVNTRGKLSTVNDVYEWKGPSQSIISGKTTNTLTVTDPGIYTVTNKTLNCIGSIGQVNATVVAKPCITSPSGCGVDDVCNTCDNCLKGFQPQPGKKYLISAWVLQDKTTNQANDAGLKVYSMNNDATEQILNTLVIQPSSKPIENWIKIEGSFEVPTNSVGTKVELLSSSNFDIYYDDVRIHPIDGDMKSYVYDVNNFRLLSELDENNYATFYEYNVEGKLVRVKKETERGVFTIQENAENIYKKY